MLSNKSAPLLNIFKKQSILIVFSTATLTSTRWENPIQNFLDFKIPNRVGTFEHYKLPKDLLDLEYNYPVCRDTLGIRWPGYWFKKKFVYVREMEPDIIVPDLTGFELKPYVSYRSGEVNTKPFTAKDLFDEVYASSIQKAFKESMIDRFDVPQEKIDESRLSAMQTGSDLFEDKPFDGVRAPLEYTMEIY